MSGYGLIHCTSESRGCAAKRKYIFPDIMNKLKVTGRTEMHRNI
jgi:hypothetical protein